VERSTAFFFAHAPIGDRVPSASVRALVGGEGLDL